MRQEKIAAHCQVCNADRFKSWRWNGLEACCNCGHVRNISLCDRENIARMQETYFDAAFVSQEDVFTRFHERLNIKRRLRELQHLVRDGRVLEVGVGRGGLLMALQSAGYQVEGLDLSDAVCAAVQARCGVSVHRGVLEAYAKTVPAGTYGAIIMCHVLEHMESLLPTLLAVRHLLKREGILYLAVPNLSSWNTYLPGWTGYEPYHVHYFRSTSLRRVLESVDFHVLHEGTFEPISGWFNAVVRSIHRRSPDLDASAGPPHVGIRQSGVLWSIYNMTRIAMGALLSPVRWLQAVCGYGEELVMIVRPK